MKLGEPEIQDVFNPNQQFVVPIFQRDYVWSIKKQIPEFWKDVEKKASEYLSETSGNAHFMGAIVIDKQKATSKEIQKNHVIDGQQRLTTFQILLIAIRNYALRKGYDDIAESIKRFVNNKDVARLEKPELAKYKISASGDSRQILYDLIDMSPDELKRKYHEHFHKKQHHYVKPTSGGLTALPYLKAYGHFYSCIELLLENGFTDFDTSDITDKEIIDALWRSSLEKFRLVEIILEEGDDAQVIFESLNDKREPLLAIDLVRNNVFHRAINQNMNEDDLYKKYWSIIDDAFWKKEETQGRYKKQRIEFFLSNFLVAKVGRIIIHNDLFSEYKAYISSNRHQYDGDVENELKDILKYASFYRTLIEAEDTSPLGRLGQICSALDASTVYPLAMRIADENNITEGEKEKCYRVIGSYLIRREVCGLAKKSYNKYFAAGVADLNNNGISLNSLSAYFTLSIFESTKYPNDEEFQRSWLRGQIYRYSSSNAIQYILREIEKAKSGPNQEYGSIRKKLSIEHIMPQSWYENWTLPNGETVSVGEFYSAPTFAMNELIPDFEVADAEKANKIDRITFQRGVVDTIGNLTLLTQPLNTKVSNSPFDIKVKHIRKQTQLRVNYEVCEQEEWDNAKILERSKSLYIDAIKLWPNLKS